MRPIGYIGQMPTVLSRLERVSRLDGTDDKVQEVVQSALPQQWMRDALHGAWFGHPLHPALVQVPIGAWISSAILDFMPRHRRGATTLLAAGTISAVPAVIAGLNDWASLAPRQRRVGLVHAASNALAIGLLSGSLAARMAGRYGLGRLLSLAGISAAGTGAFLGGHLVYKMGAAVNQATPDLHHLDEGWHPVARLGELPDKALATVEINQVPVLVYRDGDKITAMLAHCGHQGGPLGEGSLTTVDGHVCVVCPWHGSTFRLDNGEVIHGPSATDQQLLPARVMGDMLEVRMP